MSCIASALSLSLSLSVLFEAFSMCLQAETEALNTVEMTTKYFHVKLSCIRIVLCIYRH